MRSSDHFWLSDAAATKALFEKYKPTQVIHLAALGRCAMLLWLRVSHIS
jgi:hypothetical protein